MTRPPTRLTQCPECQREIGVQPDYNSGIRRAPSGMFRIAKHGTTPNGPVCLGSRIIVPEVAVYRRESAAR